MAVPCECGNPTPTKRQTPRHEHVTESVDVERPVRTAYNQWTQFEEFPQFMEGVEGSSQLDDTHMHWKTRDRRVKREFDAEITEQIPDERVAWTSDRRARSRPAS